MFLTVNYARDDATVVALSFFFRASEYLSTKFCMFFRHRILQGARRRAREEPGAQAPDLQGAGRRAREEPRLQAQRESGARESEARFGQFGPSSKSSHPLRYNSSSAQTGKVLEKVPTKLGVTLCITLMAIK